MIKTLTNYLQLCTLLLSGSMIEDCDTVNYTAPHKFKAIYGTAMESSLTGTTWSACQSNS